MKSLYKATLAMPTFNMNSPIIKRRKLMAFGGSLTLEKPLSVLSQYEKSSKSKKHE
jgi:hypothetical protein